MSFHVLSLAESPLSCVCFSETFKSALAFHTFVYFNKMSLHVLVPAKHHLTYFSKNPEVSTSHRCSQARDATAWDGQRRMGTPRSSTIYVPLWAWGNRCNLSLGQTEQTESIQYKRTGLSQPTMSLGDQGSRLGPSPYLP